VLAVLPENFLSDESVLETSDAVAAIIATAAGQFLMQLRDDIPRIFYPGFWGCFGGAVGPGEDPTMALSRELQEELEFSPTDFAKVLSLDFDLRGLTGKKNYRHYYLVKINEKELDGFILHEGAAMKLFTPAELFTLSNVTPYDAFALWLFAAQARLK
jgi:8-oxo-dGTP diphosphatase